MSTDPTLPALPDLPLPTGRGAGPEARSQRAEPEMDPRRADERLERIISLLEAAEQFRMVRILGCRSAHGLHLARPLAAPEALETLEREWELV